MSSTHGQRLAYFITNFADEQLPPETERRASSYILDAIGVMLAASPASYSAARIITEHVEEMGGRPEATIVGREFRTNCVDAALANGTLGYYADMEAHHAGTIQHALAVTVPTSLAVGERVGAGGQRFLNAVVLGVEVACRVSNALDPVVLYRRGFHPSSVAGTMGATASAGYLLRLDVPQLLRAFGLAGTQASGLLAWADDQSENARPFNIGIAARNGVTSSLLAARGFGAPKTIFDGKYDLFRAFADEKNLDALTAGLGERYMIDDFVYKRYACCAFLHPGLDALLTIAREQNLAIEDVSRIVLRYAHSGAPIIDNNPLRSHRAQYILPMALRYREIVLDHILPDTPVAPAVAALSASVFVVGDDDLEKSYPEQYRSVVEVETKDGGLFRHEIAWPKGHPRNPMTVDEVEAKFHRMATTAVSEARAADINQMVDALGDVGDVRALGALLRPGAG